MFKNTPSSIINQAFYFAFFIAILNLALPLMLWFLKVVPLMPTAIFIREIAFSLITISLACLMKYKKHLLSAILLFALACFQMVLILISLAISYEIILTGLNLLSLFYIGLGVVAVLLSLFFYYRAMKTLMYLNRK